MHNFDKILPSSLSSFRHFFVAFSQGKILNAENNYVKTVYFGVCEHLAEIDEMISRHSKGWKTARITPVSRSAIRLCIYEMLYMKDIPTAVSINEAVELVKQFDDQKMRSFVNGLLNSAKNEIETQADQ